MKATFFALTALTAFATAAPSINGMDQKTHERMQVARQSENDADGLLKRQGGCKQCIDNCKSIGGLGEAACKVVICAVEVCPGNGDG